MQTELPTMLNVLDTNYRLEFSESYTGTVGRETAVEGYQYCTISLQIAFESLLLYLKTTVYGRAHPQGTCVLLEALSLDSLVCYF